MRDCRRHPSQSQPGGGVCASCLQERLVWLWRGESFRLDDGPTSATAASQQEGDGDAPPPRPLQQGVGSLASVRKQLQVNGVAKPEIGDSRDIGEDGDAAATTTTTGKKPNVIVEWAEFHARRRRRNSEQGLDTSSSVSMAQISRSLDSVEFKPLVERLMGDIDPAARSRVSIPGKIRSRSMPLDNRSAEETALRVIREVQADRLDTDELDFLDAVDGGLKMPEQQQRRLSCIWHASNSPKRVMKLFVSPMTTSRNKKKVFPSRVGSRKRLTRFNSSDWSHADANGETHWMGSTLRAKAGMSQNTRKVDEVDRHHQRRTITTIRSSMFSWLQDADKRKYAPAGSLRSFSSSSSGSTDLWLRDLTTVGHLHEIAEELEIVEESELEDEGVPTDSLRDMSFGNFLLSAAQRQPQAGLTRLSSST